MRLPSVTFYGGVGEVGGTKILVKGRDESILLDFGKQHSSWLKYYEYPFTLPKTIDELIALNLIPPPIGELENIYTRLFSTPESFSIEDEEHTPISACIISHSHTDHVGYAFLLNRRIKLYMGLVTWEIVSARIDYSIKSGIEVNSTGFSNSNGNVETFRSGYKLRDLSIDVVPYAVDHSVPGSYGFLIDLGDLRFVYTGDFRWHGPARELTSRFAGKVRKFDADLIVCEGTQFSNVNSLSEVDVEREVRELISSCKRLIVANISPLDVDRLHTFYRVACECGRELVLNAKLAAILARIDGYNIKNYPDLSELGILHIEKKRLVKWKRSLLAGAGRSTFSSRFSEREYELGKKFRCMVEVDDLIRNPSDYILITSYYSYEELAELYRRGRGRMNGGIYIMSTSEPFDEELEVKFDKLKNWIRIAGFMYYPIHSSGHIRPIDLKKFLDEVGAKIVVPIHTDSPFYFESFIRDLNVKVLHPVRGEPLKIKL